MFLPQLPSSQELHRAFTSLLQTTENFCSSVSHRCWKESLIIVLVHVHTVMSLYLGYTLLCGFRLYLVRKGFKDSPEEFLGEKELFLRGCAQTGNPRRQAVVLPVLLVMGRQQLQIKNTRQENGLCSLLSNILAHQWLQRKVLMPHKFNFML